MRTLVLGAGGMAGHVMMRVLSEKEGWDVFGTLRSGQAKKFFPRAIAERLLTGIDVLEDAPLAAIFDRVRPDVVVNCIGLTKHMGNAEDPLAVLPINALLPHRLARLCGGAGARLIHISTDCVFSGRKGDYRESDPSDAEDLYGRSKFLGEVDYPHAVTLRTSIIGPELESARGLLGWFLSRDGRCKGFARAIFSGLPTVVFGRLVRDVVIPRPELRGVYHVAAKPIAKYDLLRLIADVYGKAIEIEKDEAFAIDRSLNAERFRAATGYQAPEWPEMIREMHAYG